MRTLSQGPYSVRCKGNWLYSAALGFAPRRWLAIKGLLVMSTWLLYVKLLSKDPWRHISELKFLKMRLLDRNNWNNMIFWMIFFLFSRMQLQACTLKAIKKCRIYLGNDPQFFIPENNKDFFLLSGNVWANFRIQTKL